MRARIVTAMVLAAVLVAVLLYGPTWAARALFGAVHRGGRLGMVRLSWAPRRVRRGWATCVLVAALAVAARALLADAQRRFLQAHAIQRRRGGSLALLWLLIAPQRASVWATALAGHARARAGLGGADAHGGGLAARRAMGAVRTDAGLCGRHRRLFCRHARTAA